MTQYRNHIIHIISIEIMAFLNDDTSSSKFNIWNESHRY